MWINPEVIVLVPRLCLGTHCPRGSASLRFANETPMHGEPGRRSLQGSGFLGRALEPVILKLQCQRNVTLGKCDLLH